jgi:hypothetical protein
MPREEAKTFVYKLARTHASQVGTSVTYTRIAPAIFADSILKQHICTLVCA